MTSSSLEVSKLHVLCTCIQNMHCKHFPLLSVNIAVNLSVWDPVADLRWFLSVTLFELTVVNNWYVIMDGYAAELSPLEVERAHTRFRESDDVTHLLPKFLRLIQT